MSANTTIEERLESVRAMLEADGYGLSVDSGGGPDRRLTLRIVAGPEACEECLVPKHLMSQLIADSVGGAVDASAIELYYPGE